MKVLFIHNGYESLGIEYLSAGLKAAGHQTALAVDPCLFDEAGFWRVPALARLFSYRERVLAQAAAFRPDYLAFSVFTDTLPWALSMAAAARARTGAKVVFGGIHPSSDPARTLANGCVDYVCLGEADLSLPALLARAPGEPLPPGVWGKEGGATLKGPPPEPPADLDALPRPDKEIFRAAAPVYSAGYLASASRGCPHACAYCCNSVYAGLYRASGVPRLRRRSPDGVAAELETAARGAGFVHFTDEVFNSDYGWLDSFLPLYAGRCGLPFSCFVFPDAGLAGYAGQLAAAGCFKVQLGVQRLDERARAELLGRRASNADIAAAVKALRAAGIYVVCDNILDLPDESERELAGLAAFYAENTPDHAEVFFLRMYPGTRLAEQNPGAPLPPGGLMRPAGYSKVPPRRQRAWASLITLLPRLPAFSRRFFAARPGLFAFAGGLPLRVLARLLSRPRRDFHTGRFARLYLRFMLARMIPG